MRKLLATACGRSILCLLLTLLSATLLRAQITVTSPVPATGLTPFSTSAAGVVVFGVKNTNATPITVTDIGNYVPSGFAGTLSLWYHTTAVTGAPTAINTTNGWVSAATKALPTTSAAGITPLFTGLSITIPAGTTYRFAISGPANSPYYGVAGSTANKYEGGGLEIYVQDNPGSPGYGGAFPGPPTIMPISFIGSITFMPTAACTEPPVAGTAVASATNICGGGSFSLNLTGGSIGTGQTYQWQSSPDNSTWTSVGPSSSSSGYVATQTTTTYYRAAVTCGATTTYSTPVQVASNVKLSGNYTINSAVATGGTNFRTFTDAVNALACGISGAVVFDVQAGSGPYTEQITIPAISGASATNTITFNGNGATIQATPVTATRHIIRLDGADYVTFNNLKVLAQPGSAFAWGVHLSNGADRNTITNCTLDLSAAANNFQGTSAGIIGTNSTTNALVDGSASNNTISNNTFIGAYQGILINGTVGSLSALNNTITRNTIKDFFANGVELRDNDGAVVSYNDINRKNLVSVGSTFTGIQLNSGNIRAIVNANRIHDTHTSAPTTAGAAQGIVSSGDDAAPGVENKITNNLIYKFNSLSGTIYGIFNSGSDYVHYLHNTVVLDHSGATSSTTRGFFQTSTATGIELKNNIIYITRGGGNTNHCVFLGANTSSIVSNKNVLYITPVGNGNGIGFYNATNLSTLTEWKTVNGNAYDQQSVSENPLFANAAADDYTPQEAFVDNIGGNVGVAKDINDQSRSLTTPDAGALEFVVPVCTGAPTPGVAATSQSVVCNSTTSFTLSVNSAGTGAGLTYQWESSTDNVNWSVINGATNPRYTSSGIAVTTYFRRVITCSGASATSAPVTVTFATPNYATLPFSESFEAGWLSVCATSDAPNNSWRNNPATGNNSWRRNDILAGFGSYTPTASAGTYSARFNSVNITPGVNGKLDLYLNANTSATRKKLTFDYINASGNDRLVVCVSTDNGGTFTRLDSVTVSTVWKTQTLYITSTSATTVLRFEALADAGSSDIGLDNIRVSDFPDCAGTPVGGITSSSAANVCAESFTLSVSGTTEANGITYQWQSSTDNTTWTNISGATGLSWTTTQMVTTYYRLLVTCASGGTATSTPVMVSSPGLVSGTYTIDKNRPTGSGNFQSFGDAYNYIKCGINGAVVFDVAAGSGPYDEQLIMQSVRGASATNTITFNGNGATLTYLSTNTNERAVIKLNGTDYVTFNNLVITAKGTTTSQYGFGVQLLNDADNNTINNCTINIDQASTSLNYAGIVVNSAAASATTTGATKCDNNIFSGNTIIGGYYGITLVGATTEATGGAVGNNQIINNTIKEFYFYGIYASGTFNTLIEGNTITRPARTTVGDFYGIYFTGLSTKANITRNTIANPFGGVPNSTNSFYGIVFTSVGSLATFENVVSNNRIYNLTGSGTAMGIQNVGSPSVWYYHNTLSIDGDATASTSIHLAAGFMQTNKADALEFKNNIITISRGGPGAKTAIYMNTNTTTMVSDRNDFYISSTTGTRNIGNWNGPQVSLANWRSATGQDAHSASTNPLFTDAANGDLKPQNAAIDNLGTNVGITKDFDGVTRSATTPDMGAYEFTAPACVVPPVVGTVAVSQTPVCSESPVMLTVSGNSTGAGQTFQWQLATSATGPFTNMGNVLTNPDTAIMAPSINLYYRLAVTCGAQTGYSEPVLLTVTQPLPAGTYTINKNAAASATNFLSFNAAKAAMTCGITGPVVFNVVSGSGPYSEQLVLDSIRNTSEINTVTFNGNGNTIKFSSSNEFERAVIKFNGADYVTLDNLVIDATGTGTYGYGVQFINNADSNTVRNCTINVDKSSTSTNFAGIVMSAAANSAITAGATQCDYNTITGNTINGGYYGITLVGIPGAYIKNNNIVNNKIYDFYTTGIYLHGNFGTLVEGNDLACPTRANVGTPVVAIYVFNVSERLRISKNRIHDPFAAMAASTNTFYGIYLQNADAAVDFANTISNNLIYNINKAGTVYGINNTGSDNALYYHNTISLDDAAYASNALTYGFYQITDAEGIVLKNNLMTINRGGTGFKYGLYFNTATTRFVSDYNNIYQIPGAKSIFGFLTADRVTLSAWKTATGKDLNTGTIDPVYANPATGNFKPLSPNLDNRGTGVGITTDIEGVARHASSPDVGAYEFAVPPCTTPPAAGTTTATPSSGMCMGTPVLLSLMGNSFGSGMSFQWEYATAASGPFLPLGAPKMFPDTVIEASGNLYYRAAVTCSGNTQYATPVQVTINPAFLSGEYTINPAQPAGATNFQSFTAAVAALECGITGPVTFKVAPGTYTEQVRMHKVAGASSGSRVTFQSETGTPSSVTLTYKATSANNYVLKLDSASYVTYKNMTITGIDSVYGRVVELSNTASYDSLANLVINAPVNDTTGTSVGGIYAVGLKGGGHVIKGNTINNGANGIYLRGLSEANQTSLNVVEGNTINGAYHHGIHVYYASRIRISNNTVNLTAPVNSIAYGVFAGYCDSAYQVVGNKVTISNTSGAAYGVYVSYCDATAQERGKVAGNTVVATTGNTGTLYGLVNNYSTFNNTVNNVASIKTTGSYSYALYSYEADNNNYYNNSMYSAATSAAHNYAAYFYHTNTSVDIRNNIFAHNGGGKAVYSYDPTYTYSDYNMLFTNGSILVQTGAAAAFYSDLQAWRNATSLDLNSLVYKPAFVSEVDLRPNLTDSTVWAMHGRGVQIAGNDYDFNNDPRPTTLTAGVPDLGAFEFVPTSVPPVLTAIPAAPAAGITQTFMMGTDTVSKITWGTTVPATISMRRYSGVTPPGLTSATPYMYYYTDVQTTGGAVSGFSKKDYFMDPWQGWINHQYQVRLGRTDAVGSWTVGAGSSVDTTANVITESGLTQLFKFTGLANVNAAPPVPVITQQIDSSNVGRRFWVAYAKSWDFTQGNNQDMVLYLSAGADPATVTVKLNGTSWSKTYQIPANTTIASDKMPKAGFYDSRLMDEGKYSSGISIESDVPIVAYAHIYYNTNSGATMLLPVGTYGYEYYTLNSQQYYGPADSHSSFFVVADRDSTMVEITPSNPTHGGRAANTPFRVMLNRGEVYQVLGAYISGNEGYDLSGSRVVSVPNASGKCYPIAVFAGSSRTRLGCNSGTTGGGDLLFQQVFPSQAWGMRYLTAPTSIAAAASNFQTNIYRVMVKDPATQVKVNGQLQTDLKAGRYYQFESITADYIEANKPVMVAQYMGSSNSTCAGSSSNYDGDPELFYLSPIEQAVKKAGFYRNNVYDIPVNYLTLTIPTAGLASLTIDGTNSFDYTYAHPNRPGYTVVVKRWGKASGQSLVQSDSAFTGIVYGEGYLESYGYNVGTLVKNLNALHAISNTLSTGGGTSEYTCTNAPFKVSVLVPVKPTTLTWSFSKVSGMTPNADVTLISPVAVDSVVINGKKYYKYIVSQDYKFNQVGTYTIPVSYTHPEIEGCSNTLETYLTVKVVQAPLTDFAVDFTNCIGDVARFSGTGGAGVSVTQWNWNFGDGGTATIQNPTRQFTTADTFKVQLKLVTPDGCVGDTTKKVPVNARPLVDVVKDTLIACNGSSVTFSVKNPANGVTYNWYPAATGGAPIGTGNSFSATVTNTTNYYVEAVSNGCASTARKKITALLLPNLATPVVVVDSASTNMVRFKWGAVAGATAYEVSTDGGTTWTEPSGALSHTVTGLRPLQPVTIIVRAKGGCQPVQSLPVTGKALIDQVFVPNSFSPNGDGLNDVLQVYGYVVKEMQFQVFNQWGEKISESRDMKRAWDGTHKGKLQPSGVYIYVCKLTLNDGSVITKKGSINLVR